MISILTLCYPHLLLLNTESSLGLHPSSWLALTWRPAPPRIDPTEGAACASEIIAAVIVFPLLTQFHKFTRRSQKLALGQTLASAVLPGDGVFLFVSLLEQIKLAVFDSGDELGLSSCHLALGSL